MKKYKPKKWFTYARLLLIFGCVFLMGRTTNIVYEEVSVKDNNEEKALSQNVINDNKEEIYVEENPVLTKYISLPEKGFNLTLGNKTVTLNYGPDCIERFGGVTIDKKVATIDTTNNYVAYTITVTAGKDGCKGLYVVDRFTSNGNLVSSADNIT